MKKADNTVSAPKMSGVFIWTWLTLLMIVAAYIRVHGANDYHYSADEMFHIDIAKGNTIAEVLRFSLNETHPPLLYLLLHFWMQISGDPSFVRGLPLVFGIALIPLYYRIGKKLNGEFTGMCASALIAFSFGLIIQSFVVRHYTLFLFLLSLSFYYYLQWREDRSSTALAAYGGFACFACMAHFTGIFAVFCIAAYETALLYKHHADWREQMRWASVNLATLLIATTLYRIWLPTFLHYKPYFNYLPPHPLYVDLGYMLLYPIAVVNYISPRIELTLLFFFLPLIILLLPPAANGNPKRLHSWLGLTGLAFTLGMALVVTNLYNVIGTRRSLWALPFIVPVAAWMLADIGSWISDKLTQRISLPWLHIMAVAILMAGYLFYPADALREPLSLECRVPNQAWQGLNHYLNALDSHHLIVSNRKDAFLLTPPDQNPYRTMGDTALTATAALIPSYHTHVLFYAPDFNTHSSASSSLTDRQTPKNPIYRLLREASEWDPLKKADVLVFVVNGISAGTTRNLSIIDLMLCPTLDKKIITFPGTNPDHPFTRAELLRTAAIVMVVPKQVFFKQVLSPAGKAHSCLQ